jgi:tRNA threonylcarbamoyladenosine modification (KEOPS) complex  Pcc1 subunit
MRVVIESEFKDPKKAKRILLPELDKDNMKRSRVKLSSSGKKFRVMIDSRDVNAARAATNRWTFSQYKNRTSK